MLFDDDLADNSAGALETLVSLHGPESTQFTYHVIADPRRHVGRALA